MNILLGNTDAHIKNWYLIYHDGINPTLAPAYDIVSSLTYINDRNNALNLGGVKFFYDLNQKSLDRFIRNTQFPDEIVNDAITATIDAAKKNWPRLSRELPLAGDVKKKLLNHLMRLQEPFKIEF